MRQAKRRTLKLLGQKRRTLVEASMAMPNVGTDADFERVQVVDALLRFMREARPNAVAVDLKQLKEEGRA